MDPTYTVVFTGNVTNERLFVPVDMVAFDLGGFTYDITDRISIGAGSAVSGDLSFQNGTLTQLSEAGSVSVGNGAGSVGVLTAFGAAATLKAANLDIGGILVRIARDTGNVGIINVDTGGTLDVDTSLGLFVGKAGDGTLNVLNSSAALANQAVIADDPGSIGHVTVFGGFSAGTIADSTAALTVTGVGTLWKLDGPFTLGTVAVATLDIGAGGVVEGQNPSPYDVGLLGEFAGTGTLIADVVSRGVFSLGLSIGVLTIEGSYTQLAEGQLRCEGLGFRVQDVLAASFVSR